MFPPSTQKDNYYKNLADNQELNKYMSMLSSVTSMLKNDVNSVLKDFYAFSFLWDEGREQAVAVSVIVSLICNPVRETQAHNSYFISKLTYYYVQIKHILSFKINYKPLLYLC